MKNAILHGRVFAVLAAVLLVFSAALTAFADTGPKPSVHVSFEDLDEGACYATLLSSTASPGPWYVWDGEEDPARISPPEDVWMAFANYEDADGYCFLQIFWDITGGKSFEWSYWPPDNFKILIYFPETGEFASSGPLTRKAFDTYYVVKAEGRGIAGVEYDSAGSSDRRLATFEAEDRGYFLKDMAVRMAVTVVIELIAALVFGLLRGKSLLIILAANVATQIILNVALFFANEYLTTLWSFVIYVALELAITATEALIYCRMIPKVWVSKKNKALFDAGQLPEKKAKKLQVPSTVRIIVYAVAANALSFATGWIITWA